MEQAKKKAPTLIDTDVHNAIFDRRDLLPYLPKAWHEQWLAQGIGVASPYYSPVGVLRRDAKPPRGGAPGSDPHYLLEHHMDRYNIDYGILTGSGVLGISLHVDPDYANAVVSAYNDWTVDYWLSVSPRYKGSILINNNDPACAVKEIERMAKNKNMVQVIMCSGARTLYGQRFFHPIYEAAEAFGLPVAIHPGTEGRGIAGTPTPAGYPTRYMEWHNILPANYMAHLNSLICEGVFEKFPKLKFVAIEGGVCWLPHFMWRLDKNYKALRDQTPWLKRLPSEYIREHIRLTTQPIEESPNPQHVVEIFEMVGADDIVMFSTDYPHWDFDNPKVVLRHFPKEMREKIFARNAIELYGLHEAAEPEKEAVQK